MRWLLCLILVVGCAGSRRSGGRNYGPPPRVWYEIPEVKNNSEEPPFLNGWPEHKARSWLAKNDVDSGGLGWVHGVRTDFELPCPNREFLDPQEPQLRVFEIKKYRAIFHGDERIEFDKRLSDLQAALHGDVTRFPEILPAVEAYPAFYTNIGTVCFEGGCGVRAVTMYVQDNNLVENGRLFYTLQGLSDDQRYWIAAYWPVVADGVRMQSHDLSAVEIETLNSRELYTEYLSEQLEILENTTYFPALEEIDEVVGGLKLKVK